MIEFLMQGGQDIQQTAKDIQAVAKTAEAVTPYLFEIIAFCFIVASHFITNIIKKARWLPAFLCKTKHSKDGNHTYRQLESYWLILIAMIMTYAGVSWALLQRYENAEQVYVVTGLICVLQWVIAEAAFSFAEGTKFEKSAAAIKGNLYVPNDSTVIMKTIAKATGGGVDKRQ